MASEILDVETSRGAAKAFVVKPGNDAKRAVLVIQEYWGVDDHIKDIANRFAGEGFIAIAPDLYRGEVTKDKVKAAELMRGLAIEDGIETIQKTMQASTDAYGITHFGIAGFCMGGTYALRAACELEGISAAVPFYGDIPPEEILKTLTTPTIFVSASKDVWINAAKVSELEEITEKYELPVTQAKYEADHAFFNDNRPEVYDEGAARDAWALMIGFFNDNL